MAEQRDNAIHAAGMMFEEIASLAAGADRHCYYTHGEMLFGDAKLEAVSEELIYLRDVIRRLGWMADHAISTLPTCATVRGNAEDWMLGPLTRDALEACREAMNAPS